jgi:hypothetical protein
MKRTKRARHRRDKQPEFLKAKGRKDRRRFKQDSPQFAAERLAKTS